MGSNDFATILGIGAVGIGGYLFVTQIMPILKRQLSNAFEEPDREERYIPSTIIEDRIPDYVVEDRYPDYYPTPQPYPVPYPQPYSVPIPYQNCPRGKFWDGWRCKNLDIDCPSGYREDDGVCKPKNCDRDEIFDGRRCIKIPRPRRNCDRDEFWNGHRCEKFPDRDWDRDRRDRDHDRDRDWDRNRDRDRDWPRPSPTPDRDDDDKKKRKYNKKDGKPPENRWGNNRDRWNADREAEEKMKGKDSPEKDRVKEVAEKAVTNFIEMWEY